MFNPITFFFFQDYNFPRDDEANLPQTQFTCEDKIPGEYYADIETGCQMFHLCARDIFGQMRSIRFLCGSGTVFDQRNGVCQDYRNVQNCDDSPEDLRFQRDQELIRSAERDALKFE